MPEPSRIVSSQHNYRHGVARWGGVFSRTASSFAVDCSWSSFCSRMLNPGDAFRPSFGDPVETKDAMLVNYNADNPSVVEVCKPRDTRCDAENAGLNHKQCQSPVDARDNQGKCLSRLLDVHHGRAGCRLVGMGSKVVKQRQHEARPYHVFPKEAIHVDAPSSGRLAWKQQRRQPSDATWFLCLKA